MKILIVGGQFGSEGKGKVAYWLATRPKEYWRNSRTGGLCAVRVGGPNSGHTCIHEKHVYIFKQLPTACLLPHVTSVISAGSYLDMEILEKELRLARGKVVIDKNASLILGIHKYKEKQLKNSIGSTGSGTGMAVISRIERGNTCILAKDCPSLAKYIGDGLDVILSHEDCIIEGNQGFGLSLLHSPYYPYVTSRDTTASGILSEVGMSPFLIDDIILVLRSFPIRVAGNSGPLANECTWEDVTTYNAYNSSNSKIVPIIEYTSVTQKIRRVGFFDPEIVKLAIKYNQPTKIVLNHVDYLSSTLDRQILNTQLRDIQDSIDRKIDYIGTSRSEIQEINSIIN